jgi:hypothetical protein
MNGDGPSQQKISAHLRACEEALLDPLVRRDSARVGALLTEDFLEFGSSGRVWTREQILELLASEDYHPPAMEDFKCDLIGEGMALVTYRTVRMEGNSVSRSAVLRSSIWVREKGTWRVRFHQGTKEL